MDVGGIVAPGEEVPGRGHELVPSLISGEGVGVELFEKLCREHLLDQGIHFVPAGPDVLQEDVVAGLVLPDGITLVVDIDSASEGVSNDQGRACKVVSPRLRMDTALEVSVAGQHGGGDKVVVFDCVLDFLWDITAIANAGHAAVASSGEPKLVQVSVHPRGLKVLGDDARARRERCLDVWLGRETLLDGLLSNETCLEHDSWV